MSNRWPKYQICVHAQHLVVLVLSVGLIFALVWLDRGLRIGNIGLADIDRGGQKSPRRTGPIQDQTGTTFAIDQSGSWLTAAHVTRDCKRISLKHQTSQWSVPDWRNKPANDTAILIGGPVAKRPIALSAKEPKFGEIGYHMGFPSGEPAMIRSTFIGSKGFWESLWNSKNQPMLIWAVRAEDVRPAKEMLGISGGPTLVSDGTVVGVISSFNERRGRIKTSAPSDNQHLVDRWVVGFEDTSPRVPIKESGALEQFSQLADIGSIRQIHCIAQSHISE